MKEIVLCCWGCGQKGIYPKTRYGKGPRCSETCYKCPGYKAKIAHKPWNKGLSAKTDKRLKLQAEKQSLTKKGKPGSLHTEETKRNISAKMMGNTNANHRSDRQSRYNNIRMDSSWEIGVAKFLDSCNIDWKYNEKGFILSNGSYYYPDFFIYIDGNLQKIIEVKGYFRERNKAKFKMFLLEYPDVVIELWEKDKLVNLGIINKSGYLK